MFKKASDNSLYYLPGAIHIHSKFSDGSGNIDEISKAAHKAGLSWIILTDHNNFDLKEGFYNRVCVIKGEEISPCENNHYLALGIKELILPDKNPEKFIQEVKNQDGFGFVAHPDESHFRKNVNVPIKWLDKSIVGDGIEIWNWFSDWADNYNDSNIFTIAYSFFFRHNLIKGAKRETLKWWDNLNNNNNDIIPAVGGLDVHALKISKYLVPVTVFPYYDSFKTLTNILITKKQMSEDFEEQKKVILEAIKQGNNIIINNRYSPADKNFEFKIKNDKNTVFCGETMKLENDTYLEIRLPCKGDIKIIWNGEDFFKVKSKDLRLKLTQEGNYRIEVMRRNKPWIYTNPIKVVL